MQDEEDDVGADVNPWPRSPMANLDVQRDARRTALSRTLFREILYEMHHMICRDGMVKLHPTDPLHPAIPSSEPHHDATASLSTALVPEIL
jgi:hypothetical protein